jgi:hypothetical protein
MRHIVSLAHNRAKSSRILVRKLKGSTLPSPFVSRLGLTARPPVLAASVVALVLACVAFLMGWVGSGHIIAPRYRITQRGGRRVPPALATLDALLAVLCPSFDRAFPPGISSCRDV